MLSLLILIVCLDSLIFDSLALWIFGFALIVLFVDHLTTCLSLVYLSCICLWLHCMTYSKLKAKILRVQIPIQIKKSTKQTNQTKPALRRTSACFHIRAKQVCYVALWHSTNSSSDVVGSFMCPGESTRMICFAFFFFTYYTELMGSPWSPKQHINLVTNR